MYCFIFTDILKTNSFSGKIEQPSDRQQEVRRRHGYTTLDKINKSDENQKNFGSLNGQTHSSSLTPVNKSSVSTSNTSSRSNDDSVSTRSQEPASPVSQGHSESQQPKEIDSSESGSVTKSQHSTSGDDDLDLEESEDIHL